MIFQSKKVILIFVFVFTLLFLGGVSIIFPQYTVSAQAPATCKDGDLDPGEDCDGTIIGKCAETGCDTETCKCKAPSEDDYVCKPKDYEDYANCTGDMVKDLNKPACLRVLPPCFKCGDCQLDDFIWLFVNMGTWGIRILPVVALVFFIWAGFGILTSRGNPQRVQGSKKFLASVVIGVIIVLVLAWAFTAFLVKVLTGGTDIFERPWFSPGGATSVTVTPPGGDGPSWEGCCLTKLGCYPDALTQEQCDALVEPYTPTYWDPNSCDQVIQCKQFEGCCVPKDPASTNCYPTDTFKRCTAEYNYESNTQCIDIEQCYIGCCVDICYRGLYGVSKQKCTEISGMWHSGQCTSDESKAGCCTFGDGNCYDGYNKVWCEDSGGFYYNGLCSSSGFACTDTASCQSL